MEENYFEAENEQTRKNFNLEEIFEFQKSHDVQIIRGEDWLYQCYIDKKVYITSLTPMNALVFGIQNYK